MIHPFPNTTWWGWNGLYPELKGDGHFLADGARLIGDIQIESESSVWFNAVLRADNAPIRIGRGTNIQDGSIVHTDPGYPVTIGQYVTIGHHAIIHGCTIADYALIGMGAILMNGARIGSRCLVAAGALLPEGFEAPEGTLVLGVPARIHRTLREDEFPQIEHNAKNYIARARQYLNELEIMCV